MNLWVRETWQTCEHPEGVPDGVRFRADDAFVAVENTKEAAERWIAAHANGRHAGRWRPAIHLPRWASRITLQVTKVRVQRLHAINNLDALAEGVLPDPVGIGDILPTRSARANYAELWDAINGNGAWGMNPWVWTVNFARVVP